MRAAPVLSGCSVASSWLIPSGNTATVPPSRSSAWLVAKADTLWSPATASIVR